MTGTRQTIFTLRIPKVKLKLNKDLNKSTPPHKPHLSVQSYKATCSFCLATFFALQKFLFSVIIYFPPVLCQNFPLRQFFLRCGKDETQEFQEHSINEYSRFSNHKYILLLQIFWGILSIWETALPLTLQSQKQSPTHSGISSSDRQKSNPLSQLP